jgi:hypothetical protein
MRARGCLIALGVVLALTAAVAAVFGPGLVRRAAGIYAPISRMKGEQREFEAWVRAHPWKEPATPALGDDELAAFLALRRDLRDLDAKGDGLRRRAPAQGERARLEDVPAIVEGMGGLVTERFAAFRGHGLTPAHYDYLEHVVYGLWLPGLAAAGDAPAARFRAAREIEQAAEREAAPAVKARLRQVAAAIRNRQPSAPPGIPADVHRLLLARAAEIEAQPTGRVSAGVPGGRGRRRPAPTTSP